MIALRPQLLDVVVVMVHHHSSIDVPPVSGSSLPSPKAVSRSVVLAIVHVGGGGLRERVSIEP